MVVILLKETSRSIRKLGQFVLLFDYALKFHKRPEAGRSSQTTHQPGAFSLVAWIWCYFCQLVDISSKVPTQDVITADCVNIDGVLRRADCDIVHMCKIR